MTDAWDDLAREEEGRPMGRAPSRDGTFRVIGQIAKAYRADDGRFVIQGLASGTRVDREDERMAETAITAFKRAIDHGIRTYEGEWSLVPLVAGHDQEWDRHLGWVTDAEVTPDHDLMITAELDPLSPNAMSLFQKLLRPKEVGKPLRLGFSIGGQVLAAGEEWDEEDKKTRRVYRDVALREMTVTGFPAYAPSFVSALAKSVPWDKVREHTVAIAREDGEDDDVAKADGMTPTAEMARVAKQALAWRDEFNRGGTAVGVARARDISNRKALSASTVRRMRSFFARHEVDKQAEGFSKGEAGFPSAGRIAWDLWGGDPGKAWANRMSEQMDNEKAVLDAADQTDVTKAAVEPTDAEVAAGAEIAKSDDEPQTDDVVKAVGDDESEVTRADGAAADPMGMLHEMLMSISARIDSMASKIDSMASMESQEMQDEATEDGTVDGTTKQVSTDASDAVAKAVDGDAAEGIDGLLAETLKSVLGEMLAPLAERVASLEAQPVDKSFAVQSVAPEDPVAKFRRELETLNGSDVIKASIIAAMSGN